MATALQRQLAAIAANSTHQLDLKAQKSSHSKSLLFEPRVAATQDFNTIYRICIDGFSQLCSLDLRFKKFENNIFSEQSRNEERGMMTEGENVILNGVLDEFLGLVSGRLALRCAVKAVEWVVRRFRVHELNTQPLILAFLPYHTTPLFLSLLSILPKQIPHTFRFLYPSISTMENPPFHTLLHTAIHNTSFFTAYNTFVLSTCRLDQQSPNILAFWASLATQAVDGMASSGASGRDTIRKQRQEDLMLKILPVLNEALSPRLAGVHDLVVAACTIVMVLAARGRLEDHVLDGLMEAVLLKSSPATVEARVTALAVCAEQREGLDLGKAVTKKIVKSSAVIDQIVATSTRIATGRIVLGLILRDLKARSKSDGYLSLDVLGRVLAINSFTEVQEKVLCERMVAVMSNEDKPITEAQRRALATIVEYFADSPQAQARFQEALTSADVEQATIEGALQTTLLLTNGAVQHDADGDANMEDASSAGEGFASTISKLEHHILAAPSFLALELLDDYALFKAAYVQSLSSDSHLQQLLQLSSLTASDESLSLPIMTLLLCLSTDSSLAQKARVTASRCLHKLVGKKTEPCAHLQFVVPYLISALSDPSKERRQVAAESIVTVAELYKTEHKKNSKSESEVHRHTYVWEVLSQDAMRYLLSSILVPNLEEAILDSNSITKTVSRVLNKAEKKPKKSKNSASEICDFLAHHAAGTTLAGTKLTLLKMINGSGIAASHAQEATLVAYVVRATASSMVLADVDTLNRTVLDDLRAELWRSVVPSSVVGLDALTNVLAGRVVNSSKEMVACAYNRVAEIWNDLSDENSTRIADLLVEGTFHNSETSEPELYSNLASEMIRSLALPGRILSQLITSLPNALNMPDAPPATKRRRTSRSEKARMSSAEPANLNAALAKYTFVLELVESNTPGAYPELLQGLFKVLEELQNFRLQTSSGLVYLQGLAMNCLLAVVDRLKGQKDAKPDLSSIRTDLIVDCIRHSNNAQVQSTALLLVSSLASWQPDTVVNSIMPIFTFMGTTILRQGDEYSAHVTERTISRVVPPLVESFRKKNKDIVIGASSLLLSFTAAFEHIPLNRRLAVFEHLARTVGAEECLYALIAMLTDAYPTDVRARKFVAELLNQFEPSTSLITVRKCLDLTSDIFRPRRTLSNHILNLSERPRDTHDNVAQNLLNALSDLLHDKRLRAQMSRSFDSGDLDTANAQRTACVGLIQEAIRLNQALKAKPELVKAGGKLLSSIVGLLPTPELVQCAETLLAQKDEEVRLVAVGSVLNRAKEARGPSADDAGALLGFMQPLVEVLRTSDSAALSAQAVTCLGQIVKSFGKKDTSTTLKAVQVIAGEKALKHADGQVQLASVVSLTVAVRILKDEFIPLVPSVLPVVFSYLENNLATDEQSKALSLSISCFAFVQALVEQLPFLVTGESLDKVLLLLAQAGEVSKLKESRGHLWRLVAKNVDASEALPAFERNYQAVSEVGSLQGLVEMFSTLRLAITSRPKSEIVRNASTLFELFLQAFDQQRIIQTSDQEEVDYDDEELEKLELIYQEVALLMVMKLSDSTFRPFIVRLSEWATQLPMRDVKGRLLRATSMFSFLASLFAKLKGLVTSYATYALDLAVDALTNTEPGQDDAEELLEAVLIALTQSFEHDDEGFWTSPHHFTPISTPLLALLTKSALSQTDDTDLVEKVQEAVRALVSTTSAQDQHRTINTALLRMMRHENAKVRLAAVKTERELCEKMGDEWLGMLPEMLPFVAELMEDDDKEVERAGREWVRFLEGVLGENLDLS